MLEFSLISEAVVTYVQAGERNLQATRMIIVKKLPSVYMFCISNILSGILWNVVLKCGCLCVCIFGLSYEKNRKAYIHIYIYIYIYIYICIHTYFKTIFSWCFDRKQSRSSVRYEILKFNVKMFIRDLSNITTSML